MNFTRWSARLPGTQRRAARGTEGSVPAARGEYARQQGQLGHQAPDPAEAGEAAGVPTLEDFSVRELLGRLPGLVALVYGPEHRIAYVNDAYAAAFGPRPAGATVADTCPEAEELGLLPLIDQVLRSGKPRTVKSRRTQDGGSYTVTCLPVDSPHLDDGVLVHAADVTDHAEAAERLRASERRHRETAVTLQRSLLPQDLEQPDDLRIAATYQPGGTDAAVGGDWYDVITLGAGRTALVIGDVMGRGVRAAAVMGQLRTAVRAYARLDLPPHEVLQLLDGLAAEIDASQIATCVYAIHDPNEGKLVYASAGHLPILVRDEDGSVRRAEDPTGPPLGTGGWLHASGSIALPPGSTAVLYTDGLVERRREDIDEGVAALARALSGASGTPRWSATGCSAPWESPRSTTTTSPSWSSSTPPARERTRSSSTTRPWNSSAGWRPPPRACLRLRGPVLLALPDRAARPGRPRHQRTRGELPPARHPAHAAAPAPHGPPPDHRGDGRGRPPSAPPQSGDGGRGGPRNLDHRDDRLVLGEPPHPGGGKAVWCEFALPDKP